MKLVTIDHEPDPITGRSEGVELVQLVADTPQDAELLRQLASRMDPDQPTVGVYRLLAAAGEFDPDPDDTPLYVPATPSPGDQP